MYDENNKINWDIFYFFKNSVNKYKNNIMFKSLCKNNIIEKSYYQIYEDVIKLGKYMKEYGVVKENVIMMGRFDEKWIITYFALIYAGNTVIPLEDRLSFEDIQEKSRSVDARLILVSNEFQNIIFKGKKNVDDFVIINYEKFQFEEYFCGDKKAEENTAMIVFTSGTTGKAKGVVLTHENIMANVRCCQDLMKNTLEVGDPIMVVLPPYHMFQITAGFLTPISLGLIICGSDIKAIKNAIQIFRPAVMVVVPVIIEGMYKQVMEQIRRKKMIIAMKIIELYSRVLLCLGVDQRKRLFKQIQKTFGEQLKVIICGGAPIEVDVIKRFDQWGINIWQGYGMTECSPVISCNRDKRNKVGSVGQQVLSEYCQIKIIRGEICVKGAIVFEKYYGEEVRIEEWYPTGDLGYFDQDGYLFLTGRKKNLIILSDGNNISPEQMERKFIQSRYISDCIVKTEIINGNTVLSVDVLPEWSELNNINTEKIQEFIENEVYKINKYMPSYMRIRCIHILDKIEKTILGKIRRT